MFLGTIDPVAVHAVAIIKEYPQAFCHFSVHNENLPHLTQEETNGFDGRCEGVVEVDGQWHRWFLNRADRRFMHYLQSELTHH